MCGFPVELDGAVGYLTLQYLSLRIKYHTLESYVEVDWYTKSRSELFGFTRTLPLKCGHKT